MTGYNKVHRCARVSVHVCVPLWGGGMGSAASAGHLDVLRLLHASGAQLDPPCSPPISQALAPLSPPDVDSSWPLPLHFQASFLHT